MSIKVSVIIPVCNVSNYITRCVESVMNQTLKDIEIICVDDCSSDGSDAILKELAAKDDRIKTIFHSENLSTSQARKDGVAISTGEYIMFLDGDDEYYPHACERAYEDIVKKEVDILQFKTEVINAGNVPPTRISMNERLLNNFTEERYDGDLVAACWEEKLFKFTLWNKIYKGDIVREAFSRIEDGSFPKAQDLYAFFAIASLSHSFIGINEMMYKYSFGTGVTGKNSINMEQFNRILTEKRVADALSRYIEKYNMPQYGDIVKLISMDLCGDCANNFVYNLPKYHQPEGMNVFVEQWGYEDVIFAMAKVLWIKWDKVIDSFKNADYFSYKIQNKKDKKVKTIAANYRCIINGGAQRVVATLCNMWVNMKDENGDPMYKVVLITEEGDYGDEVEYELDEKVERAYLPSRLETSGVNFSKRYYALWDILDKFDIDIIVNSMWMDPTAFWDLTAIRKHPSQPAYVVHTHSFNCVPYTLRGRNAYELTKLYKIVDGVVVLSDCDYDYVSTFSKTVKNILNPSFILTENVEAVNGEEPNIAWIGRLSKEKQPLEVVRAMKYVVRTVPNAKLYLVGSGDDDIREEIEQYIVEHNLQDNIVMPGFSEDVEEYYKKTAVLAVTSKYEGFPLTPMEAMTYGIPVAMYDLPWLSIVQDGRGVAPVEYGQPKALAKEICKLLTDREYWKSMSDAARQQMSDNQNVDIANEWHEFFNSLYEAPIEREMTNKDILLKYLAEYQQEGKNNLREDFDELTAKYQGVCNDKSERGIKIKRLEAEKAERGVKIKRLEAEKFERGVKIKQLEKEKFERGQRIKELENSNSYKIGLKITKPYKILKRIINKILKRQMNH